jgi:putative hydrolase of the HAD superfamily
MTDEEFRALWVRGYKIDPVVRQYVLNARKQGYLACVCSNNNIARVTALQEKFSFLNDFDVKIFSYEVGFPKPSKEIFQALIETAGVRPDEIVYSDDNPERIQGAKDLGMNVFVYENFPQFQNELEKLGIEIA